VLGRPARFQHAKINHGAAVWLRLDARDANPVTARGESFAVLANHCGHLHCLSRLGYRQLSNQPITAQRIANVGGQLKTIAEDSKRVKLKPLAALELRLDEPKKTVIMGENN
jgi:hypothetical protein